MFTQEILEIWFVEGRPALGHHLSLVDCIICAHNLPAHLCEAKRRGQAHMSKPNDGKLHWGGVIRCIVLVSYTSERSLPSSGFCLARPAYRERVRVAAGHAIATAVR